MKVTSRRLKGEQQQAEGTTWSSCFLFSEGLDLDGGCVTWCEGLGHATRLTPTHSPVGSARTEPHNHALWGCAALPGTSPCLTQYHWYIQMLWVFDLPSSS